MPIIINGNSSPRFASTALAFGLSAALAQTAQAAELKLTLSGVFNGTTAGITETLTPTGGGANLLTTPNEAFTMTGIFDSSSPNLIAGLPFPVNAGWVDFAPLSVTLTVGGTTYSVATYDPSIPMTGGPGLTVAIFDTTTIFAPPPPPLHYAAGFIQNPVADGAGIVGDFLTAAPPYTASSIVPTTYSDYFGAGFGPGVCMGGPGSGIDCSTTPIPLDGGAFQLTLGGISGYDLENPANGMPIDPDRPRPNYANGNFFSASLTAVPEPSTWALLLAGFAGLAVAGS